MKQIKDEKQSNLTGESTEKRSISFVSAQMSQSQMKSDRVKGLDVREHSVLFGDDDNNFDLQLDNLG